MTDLDPAVARILIFDPPFARVDVDVIEVRDMMALVTAVALPENTPAFERALKLDKRMTARVIDLLEDIAERNEVSLSDKEDSWEGASLYIIYSTGAGRKKSFRKTRLNLNEFLIF